MGPTHPDWEALPRVSKDEETGLKDLGFLPLTTAIHGRGRGYGVGWRGLASEVTLEGILNLPVQANCPVEKLGARWLAKAVCKEPKRSYSHRISCLHHSRRFTQINQQPEQTTVFPILFLCLLSIPTEHKWRILYYRSTWVQQTAFIRSQFE